MRVISGERNEESRAGRMRAELGACGWAALYIDLCNQLMRRQ
jgi:hypothetical protein